MTQLNTSIKKQITKDWQEKFPDFKARKPMLLVRRVGCLIQGIELLQKSDKRGYYPTMFVHNLLVESPALLFSIDNPFKSNGELHKEVTIKQHNDSFDSLTEEFNRQLVLDISGNIKFSELSIVAANRLTKLNTLERCNHTLLELLVLVPWWLGKQACSSNYLEWTNQVVMSWPEEIVNSEFVKHSIENLNSPTFYTQLDKVLENQIAEHHLQDIPTYELEFDNCGFLEIEVY